MAKACFLTHDAHGAINDTIAFIMLRWLFRGFLLLFVSVLVPVLVPMSLVCLWFHVMLMPKTSHDKKMLGCTFIDHLDLRNAIKLVLTSSASCDISGSVNGIIWPKHFVTPHFDHLILRNSMCHWWQLHHDMMPMLMAAHDQKWHAVSHFNKPYLKNATIKQSYHESFHWHHRIPSWPNR